MASKVTAVSTISSTQYGAPIRPVKRLVRVRDRRTRKLVAKSARTRGDLKFEHYLRSHRRFN